MSPGAGATPALMFGSSAHPCEDMRKFRLAKTIESEGKQPVGDFLSAASGLSRERVDDALGKGALWLRRTGRKGVRLRQPGFQLRRGDSLEFCYDESLLGQVPPRAECVADEGTYSAWYKPAGLLTQGTRFGDHCSLLRQAELHFRPPRPAFPVHRLDREAGGLVLVAHSREAAAALSGLIQKNAIRREYRARVRGNPGRDGREGIIDAPLDGKPALTEYRVIAYDAQQDISDVTVLLKTGRLHQIRRHFDMLGFPVMGDPRYGRRNKNQEGLRLEAFSLQFNCPMTGRRKEFLSPYTPPSISSESGLR